MNPQEQTSTAQPMPKKPMGRARVKPRHLSPVLWQLIVDQFKARKSSEDVAEELGLPVRTVSDVIDLHRMGIQPVVAKPFLLRRSA